MEHTTEEQNSVVREARVPEYSPYTDITRTDDHYELRLEIPGTAPGNVDVEVEKNILTVSTRNTAVQIPEGYRLAAREYRHGNFRRRFTLGEEIDSSGIKARVENGVLQLTLPRRAPQKLKIEIAG